MRIIAGSAKGRRLTSPKSKDIRPVLDQVKESIFNILFDINGFSVLDIFAGTGSIGLEAISRGATNAVFVDNGKEAINIIKKNIEICRFEDRSRIIPLSAEKAVSILKKESSQFDIIFIDPPYLKNLVNKTICSAICAGLLKKDGLIITEHHPKEPVQNLPEGYGISDERKYGQTIVTFVACSSRSPCQP